MSVRGKIITTTDCIAGTTREGIIATTIKFVSWRRQILRRFVTEAPFFISEMCGFTTAMFAGADVAKMPE